MRALRPLALLAVALGLLAAAAPASAAVPRGFFGVVAEDVFAGDTQYREQHLATQAALGITVVRQTFDWSEIERSPGVYDLHRHDAFVAQAAQHGIQVLPILFRPPAFRSSAPASSARGTHPPRRHADLGRFGAALAARYGPTGSLWRQYPGLRKLPIRSWQVWNEPNLRAYWPAGPNARAYASMLRAVSRAIKRVDRRADIVSAGMPESRLGTPLLRYLEALYRAGGHRGFDTLAVNPYARTTRELMSRLKAVRKLMNRHGDRRARIWITEIGWSDDGPPAPFRVGAQRQASLISGSLAQLARARRKLGIRGVVYFAWRDGRPYAPDFRDMWGLHTGLLDANGLPKPGLFALQQAIRRLR